MENVEKKLDLFNSPDVILKHGEQLRSIWVKITPDGGYADNGRFNDPGDTIFKIIGFDRSNGREFWIGQGFIKVT